MSVSALNHYTVRCRPQDLQRLFDFYTDIVGLVDGPRPPFSEPGHWLYSGGQPIVHLIANISEPTPPETGPLDHIAFRAHDLMSTRAHLAAKGIPFIELPVPERPLHQVFIHDPGGLRLELTFSTDEETV